MTYEETKNFFLYYACEDYGHTRIAPLSEVIALAMIMNSPYYDQALFEKKGMITADAFEWNEGERTVFTGLSNKGSLRISPDAKVCSDRKRLQVKAAGGQSTYDNWSDPNREFYATHNASRNPLWVYNHDGQYWLTKGTVGRWSDGIHNLRNDPNNPYPKGKYDKERG